MDWKKREQSVENNIWKPNTGWWKTPLENTEEKYEIEPEDSGEKENPTNGENTQENNLQVQRKDGKMRK